MRVPEPVVDYPAAVAFHNHEQCRQESINTSFVDIDVRASDMLITRTGVPNTNDVTEVRCHAAGRSQPGNGAGLCKLNRARFTESVIVHLLADDGDVCHLGADLVSGP